LHTDIASSRTAPPRWYSRSRLFQCNLPANLVDWLLNSGSLTQRLRQLCPGQFRVHVLWQGWNRPSPDEARVLGLRLDAWAWTREVRLLCNDQPWIFARTLIPAGTLCGRCCRLTQLGTRSLGEVLFADPGIRRDSVEITRIAAGQRLYQRAFVGFSEPPDTIWGRRSVFWIAKHPLLICEIFLPDLPVASARYRPG
jgi:chorismate--pyruvate lyase